MCNYPECTQENASNASPKVGIKASDIKKLSIVLPTKVRTKVELEADRQNAIEAVSKLVKDRFMICDSNTSKEVIAQCDIVFFAYGWRDDPIAVDANSYAHELRKSRGLRVIEEF